MQTGFGVARREIFCCIKSSPANMGGAAIVGTFSHTEIGGGFSCCRADYE